jgi:hypothetical protein
MELAAYTLAVALEVIGYLPELPVKAISDLKLRVRGFAGLPRVDPGENSKPGTLILRILRCCQKLHMEGLP